MPREENKNCSLGIPREQRIIFPTIISMMAKPKPTIIHPSPSPKNQPTIIPSDPENLTAQKTQKPYVPKIANKEETNIQSLDTPQTSKIVKPTGIPGVKRQRIDITITDLQQLNLATKQTVLEQAYKLILETDLSTLNEKTVVFWGQEFQKKYADLVSKCLEFSQSAILQKISGYLNRMIEILESIDLAKIYGTDADKDGIITRFFKKSTKTIDSLPELHTAQTELDQLIKLMNGKLDELLNLKIQIQNTSKEIDKIGEEVESSSIAAEFIGNYTAKNKPEISNKFLERSMSLTQTLAQISSTSSLRQAQIEQPINLISIVQNVALVTIPGLIISITSIKTLLSQRQPTVTEINELNDQIYQTLQKLK